MNILNSHIKVVITFFFNYVIFISLHKMWQDHSAFKHVCLFQKPYLMLVEDWTLIWCIIIIYFLYYLHDNYKIIYFHENIIRCLTLGILEELTCNNNLIKCDLSKMSEIMQYKEGHVYLSTDWIHHVQNKSFFFLY